MKKGDWVICIAKGDGSGPDCKVGNIFQIKGFEELGALIFSCHPYLDPQDDMVAIAARRIRFRLLHEPPIKEKVVERIEVK